MSAVDPNFSWQDRISSCIVTDEAWLVYKDSEWRGSSAYLPPGRYPDGDAMRIGGDVMSSARPVPYYADPDPHILLFKDANYNGILRIVGEDLPSLHAWSDSGDLDHRHPRHGPSPPWPVGRPGATVAGSSSINTRGQTAGVGAVRPRACGAQSSASVTPPHTP